jgi:hypothetical protein
MPRWMVVVVASCRLEHIRAAHALCCTFRALEKQLDMQAASTHGVMQGKVLPCHACTSGKVLRTHSCCLTGVRASHPCSSFARVAPASPAQAARTHLRASVAFAAAAAASCIQHSDLWQPETLTWSPSEPSAPSPEHTRSPNSSGPAARGTPLQRQINGRLTRAAAPQEVLQITSECIADFNEVNISTAFWKLAKVRMLTALHADRYPD